MRGRRLATAALLLCLCLPGLALAAAPPASIFGSPGVVSEPPFRLPQWDAVLRAVAAEEPVYAACARSPDCLIPELGAWLDLLAALAQAPRPEQLARLNAWVNQRPYRSDPGNYGRRDHWATPLEFLTRSGDCEDYAILKYVSLRRLGVPADELRLVVVQDLLRDTPHAVLLAQLGEDWQVLDNLSPGVLPQGRIGHYRPYYAVNEAARWSHLPQTAALPSLASAARRD